MLLRNRKRQIHEIVMHCNLCRSAVTLRGYQILFQIKQSLLNQSINKTAINNGLSKHSYHASCKLRQISSQNKSIEELEKKSYICPKEVYKNRVKEGEVSSDDHQINVVNELSRLAEELVKYRPPTNDSSGLSILRNIAGGFLRWNKKDTSKLSNERPKGVYIWGTV